ncbi:MAG: undecaprenyl-diphosphate phosphatase [Syntrophaceae bacterium]|nr:undecaprenyl-diphosphate phosphatase [Syntrophaceae bacterium]
MTYWHALILGIIEGISEFLPISSTGHLILTSHLLHLQQTDFQKSFEIAIQLGAILSVVVLYWRMLLVNIDILKRVIVAFIPTAVLGLFFYKMIKEVLLGSYTIVLVSLWVGGILLILFELWHREKESASDRLSDISYSQSFIIGLCQSVAMIPGVSRSAATIIGGLILGIQRKTIVEFSFLLSVPTMAAATGLDMIKSGGHFSSEEFYLLLMGFIISFIVALLSVKWLIHFIKNHTFLSFGIYRILISLLFWVVIW